MRHPVKLPECTYSPQHMYLLKPSGIQTLFSTGTISTTVTHIRRHTSLFQALPACFSTLRHVASEVSGGDHSDVTVTLLRTHNVTEQ